MTAPFQSSALEISHDTILATLRIDQATVSITYRAFSHEQVDRVSFPPRDATPEQVEDYCRKLLRQTAQRLLCASRAEKEDLASSAELKHAIESKQQEMLLRKLREKADARIPAPSEEAIQAFYTAHQEDFRKPETFRIQTVNSYCPNPADEKAMQAAWNRLLVARDEIQEGSDFIRVAIKYSNSPLPYRGETISFTAGELHPNIEKNARSLKNGEISPPFPTRMGGMIIRRMGYEPSVTSSLSEMAPAIKLFLANQAKETGWDSVKRQAAKSLNPHVRDVLFSDNAPQPDEAVLEFDGRSMSWAELQAQGDRASASLDGLNREERKKRINSWIESALLAHIARETFKNDPDIQSEARQIRQDLLFREKQRRLLDRLRGDIQIPAEQAREYVENNPRFFLSEKQTRIDLLNIPFTTEPASACLIGNHQKAEALRKAYEAREKLQRNQDASQVAAEYCGKDWKCERDFAPQGPRGRLIDMAVDALQAGHISEPLEHAQGYYLIRLLEVREAAPLPPEDSIPKAIQILTGMQARERLETELDKTLADSSYRIKPDAFPALLEKIKGLKSN